MAKDRFTTVRIKRELHRRIKSLIEDREDLPYHTVSGFIDDAVKAQLKEIDKTPKPLGAEGEED